MVSVYLEDFKASTTLMRGKGYCVQKAVLLAALARAAGIPARLVFARIRNHMMPTHLLEQMGTDILPRHGYNQLYINRRWVTTAATFDKELCHKKGLPTGEFDGVHDTTLPKTDLAGNLYIEYLETFEPQADLPLEWVAEGISEIWGKEKRAWSGDKRNRF